MVNGNDKLVNMALCESTLTIINKGVVTVSDGFGVNYLLPSQSVIDLGNTPAFSQALLVDNRSRISKIAK